MWLLILSTKNKKNKNKLINYKTGQDNCIHCLFVNFKTLIFFSLILKFCSFKWYPYHRNKNIVFNSVWNLAANNKTFCTDTVMIRILYGDFLRLRTFLIRRHIN